MKRRIWDMIGALPLVAGVTLAVDQASKLFVVFGLDLVNRGEMDVLPPFLVFRMAWNDGVNFGLLGGQPAMMRWVLVALALAIATWVVIWVRREKAGVWMQAAAGLLVGGALGNVIDRVAYGKVADFLNMSCCGIDNPFAFNVADVAVFVGAIGLVALSGREGGGSTPKGSGGGKTP
jgi:signal peptidase II